jgi:hypothetical protein
MDALAGRSALRRELLGRRDVEVSAQGRLRKAMRTALNTNLVALISAALIGGMTPMATAGPHGGDSGDHGGSGRGDQPRGGGPAAFTGAGDHGGQNFAGQHSAMSFGAPHAGQDIGRMAAPRAERMDFAPRTFREGPAAGEGRFRGGPSFAQQREPGGPSGGWRGGPTAGERGSVDRGGRPFAGMEAQRFQGAERVNGIETRRNGRPDQGFRGEPQAFAANRFSGAVAGAPNRFRGEAFNEGFRDQGFDQGFRGDFEGWRGWNRDRDDFGWDDWLWPVGVGFALDLSLGYAPCAYWYDWDDPWGCRPRGLYPAYYPRGAYEWAPTYGWPSAYAWDAVYVSEPSWPATTYAVWTPDDAWIVGYAYVPDTCIGRDYVWDPYLGGYVLRRFSYACEA